jgi:hypothetical protein
MTTQTMEPKQAAAIAAVSPGGMRFTNSFVQYDVSADNPKAIANLAKAIAGNLSESKHTFFDPETKSEKELGKVLVAIDLSDPNKIVLQHKDDAGKGEVGRIMQSAKYINEHWARLILMKGVGWISDPEKIYVMEVNKFLAALEQTGMFGPPGSSTLNLDDWNIETRTAWRDVVITRKKTEEKTVELNKSPELSKASFSDTMRKEAGFLAA